MKGHGTKFAQKPEDAIAALLTHRNIDEAAKAVGIAPNTLLKWMKQPEFDTAYREARRKAFGQCRRGLADYLDVMFVEAYPVRP